MFLKLDSMATKLVNPGSQVVHSEPRMRKMLITHSSYYPPIIHPWTMRKTIADGVRPIHTTKVAEQSPGLVNDNKEIKENDKDYREVEQIKADLYQAVQGMSVRPPLNFQPHAPDILPLIPLTMSLLSILI